MTNKVLHAFPSPSAFTPDGDTLESGYNGMMLRDYFAAKAMQGDMAAQSDNNGVGLFLPSMDDADLVKSATFYYRMADAMLCARQVPSNALYK